MKTIKIICLLLCSQLYVSYVIADDVIKSINDAIAQYKKGNLTGAAGNLDYASQLIRQMKAEKLTLLLPEAETGWTTKKAKTQAAGAAMMGGMLSVEKTYRKQKSRITVTIVTDSPMLQVMLMMFNNPMFFQSGGGKLERINGEKSVIKYKESNNSGEIQSIIASRFLVTVAGRQVSQDELMTYMKKIDFKKLSALP